MSLKVSSKAFRTAAELCNGTVLFFFCGKAVAVVGI